MLPGPAAEAVSCVLLGAMLLTAIIRPRRLPEAAVAVPAALIVVLTGAPRCGCSAACSGWLR